MCVLLLLLLFFLARSFAAHTVFQTVRKCFELSAFFFFRFVVMDEYSLENCFVFDCIRDIVQGRSRKKNTQKYVEMRFKFKIRICLNTKIYCVLVPSRKPAGRSDSYDSRQWLTHDFHLCGVPHVHPRIAFDNANPFNVTVIDSEQCRSQRTHT